MEESRQFAMSELNASLRGRVDVARERMEAAKRRMETYCRELGEEVVMDRTRVIRERYPWYQNFVDVCFGHGRRSMEVEPEYLGDGYEGEISRLNRGARIITRGMEMLNAEFFGQQQDRRRLALERDLNARLRNPLWRTNGPDMNPEYVPPVLQRIPTPIATPSSSSTAASTSNRTGDDFSRLTRSPDVSFRILRDFVHEDAIDDDLDDPHRLPVRPNQPSPPPAVDFPDMDDDMSIGHGSIPEDAVDSSDDGNGANGDDDDVAPAVPVSAPVVPVAVPAPAVPVSPPVVAVFPVLAAASGIAAPLAPVAPVVAAAVAAAPALPVLAPVVAAVAAAPAIAAAPLAPVAPIRRRKRVWNVGIAPKNEPPRKKVQAEGEEADFGSVGALGEEAEALHEMLLDLDLETLHLEVDTKLSRVRGSVKRWGRQMSATLFKKNANAINFCRIAMGVKD